MIKKEVERSCLLKNFVSLCLLPLDKPVLTMLSINLIQIAQSLEAKLSPTRKPSSSV